MTAAAPARQGVGTDWTSLWTRFSEWVAAALFAMMFVAFMIQIVSRYVLNMPVSWSLELCSIGYVWVVFWSCGILVQRAAADRLRRALPQVPAARSGGCSRSSTPPRSASSSSPPCRASLDYVLLPRPPHPRCCCRIRMDLVYSCFAIFMVAVIVGAAIRIWRLFRPVLANNTSEGRR